VAQARIGKERILDRFEQEEADFHERVRQCYLQRAGQSNGRIRVVQADRTVDEIKKSIEELISTICL